MRKIIFGGIMALQMAFVNQTEGQSLYYDFNNTLNERTGSAPALNPLGVGGFVNDTLSELSCLPVKVYNFANNDGVQFDNAAAGSFLGETYSIEMYFKWLDNGGFKRIIDFKNRTSDFGLYATPSVLSFYDGLDINTTSFVAGQYVYLCVTRDSATQEVTLFIDGVPAGGFTDVNERGTIDTSQVLNFFRDDLVFGGEARQGNIAFLKLHNFELGAAQIAASYAALKDSRHILSFTQDVSASCLAGNVVNFTNTSENDSTLVSYTWDFGDGNTAAGANASHSYSAAGNYTVALIATDGAGCFDTAFSAVEIYPQPVVDLGPDVSSCQGATVTLDAGSAFTSYQWNNSSTTQTIDVTASGTYYATVTDGNGCAASDSVTVTFNPLPAVALPGDTVICDGSVLLLTAPTAMVSYQWSTGETTQDIVVAVSGIYAVSVTDVNGCGASDTISITVNALPVITLGADTAICDGATLTLDPGAGFSTYAWTGGSTNQTLDVTSAGAYAVVVTDVFGCSAIDSIIVSVNTLPLVDLGADTTICGGTLVTLDAGSGQTSYLWSDGSQNQTLDVITGGNYSVTVTDANGCSSSDIITLTVTPLLSLGADFTVCDGQAVTLDAGNGFASYAWSTGETTQTIQVAATGVYGVSITDGNGCYNTDSVSVTFGATAVVDLGPDLTVCQNTTVSLDAGSGFVTYVWSDGSSLQTLDVTTAGTYVVTVTNGDGCSATDSVTISYNAAPVVTLYGDTTLCFGNTLLLDAGAGFSSYLWDDGSTGQTYTVSTAGTFTVTVTDQNGCTGSDAINVSYNPPVPTPSVAQINSNTIQSSSISGNQWYQVPGGLIAGATSQTYSPPQNGTFYVIVTDANGCQSAASNPFGFINTGIGTAGITSVNVFPNPASGAVNILTSGINENKLTVSVIDLAGRAMFEEEIPANASVTLDISSLAAGTYCVRLLNSSVTEIRMITVK